MMAMHGHGATPSHAKLRCAMPSRTKLRRAAPSCITPRRTVPRSPMVYDNPSRRVIPHHTMPRHATSRHVTPRCRSITLSPLVQFWRRRAPPRLSSATPRPRYEGANCAVQCAIACSPPSQIGTARPRSMHAWRHRPANSARPRCSHWSRRTRRPSSGWVCEAAGQVPPWGVHRWSCRGFLRAWPE